MMFSLTAGHGMGRALHHLSRNRGSWHALVWSPGHSVHPGLHRGLCRYSEGQSSCITVHNSLQVSIGPEHGQEWRRRLSFRSMWSGRTKAHSPTPWRALSQAEYPCSQLQQADDSEERAQDMECMGLGVVGSVVVGMLLTCVAFWCFIAACITGFACAGAGFGVCRCRTQS